METVRPDQALFYNYHGNAFAQVVARLAGLRLRKGACRVTRRNTRQPSLWAAVCSDTRLRRLTLGAHERDRQRFGVKINSHPVRQFARLLAVRPAVNC